MYNRLDPHCLQAIFISHENGTILTCVEVVTLNEWLRVKMLSNRNNFNLITIKVLQYRQYIPQISVVNLIISTQNIP